MNRITTFAVTALLALLMVSCSESRKPWRIGVSQCSEDIWRHKQNGELIVGGYVDNAVELEFLSADDSDERQIEQINHFIEEKVDLIIVSPNSAASLTPVIDKAYDSGIPVILFDRRTDSDKYTAYISADNYAIGNTMGKLIARDMKGKGTLVEITGLKGSSPAKERHRGFADAIAEYPQIRLISSELGDWTEESGIKAMAEVLKHDRDIDCIFGHNDRLALGARNVALSHGLKNIKYYGVDALPVPGGGIDQVQKGVFEATYIYPTQGLEVMRLARKIL
ncbi:MAG: substrate-binding domain-containing protein, partial [Prevotella sp.]|nr:substrate-binding domain-containing protein [Prevotella sp.]